VVGYFVAVCPARRLVFLRSLLPHFSRSPSHGWCCADSLVFWQAPAAESSSRRAPSRSRPGCD